MIGERIFRFESIDSTNEYALKNCRLLHNGDVVVALEQTRGRGRHGRTWHSPRGGLWVSIVFKPKKVKELGFYTKIAAVSLARLLSKLGVKSTIKWPNDILVNGRKLAGILTEGIFEGVNPKCVVMGIGVNVSNDIPNELKDIAISLKEILKSSIPPEAFLDLLLKMMNATLQKYKNAKGALTRVWKSLLDLKEGERIQHGDKECEILKILPDHLVLNCEGKKVNAYDLER